FGFDCTFEAYVAETLGQFGMAEQPARNRLWIAEDRGRVVGSIGIIGREGGAAQLRWFLLHPDVRGRGLGRQLVSDALAFCRECGCSSVYLWTVHVLTAAARLYTAAGFRKTEEKPPAALWGLTLAEQRYDLALPDADPERVQ
ncbi:MAG: GNAT family N-acetyltransferase, partial [Dehalococcoidia bacterium]